MKSILLIIVALAGLLGVEPRNGDSLLSELTLSTPKTKAELIAVLRETNLIHNVFSGLALVNNKTISDAFAANEYTVRFTDTYYIALINPSGVTFVLECDDNAPSKWTTIARSIPFRPDIWLALTSETKDKNIQRSWSVGLNEGQTWLPVTAEVIEPLLVEGKAPLSSSPSSTAPRP